jgi:hypothetical protein
MEADNKWAKENGTNRQDRMMRRARRSSRRQPKNIAHRSFSCDADGNDGRHAGAQLPKVDVFVEIDPNRHALHDFGKIPRRVVRRKQREL